MVEAGSLKFSLNYDTCQFGAHSMLALAEEIGAACREVIDSCTRSDSAGSLRAPQMNPTVNYLHFHQGWGTRFNTSVALRMADGVLEPALLERAIAHVLARHDELRLQFATESGALTYVVMPPLAGRTVLQFEDMASVADDVLEEAFIDRCNKWQADLRFDEQSYLFRFVRFACGAGRGERLLVLFHHMLVDGESSRILIEELLATYEELGRRAPRKEVLLLPPDQRSWNALFPVASETGFLYDIDCAR